MIWDHTPEAAQIDHAAAAAEARWQALIARIDQATAADYVCDQLRAELMTDGTALCAQLGAMCASPPDMWDWEQVAATFTSLEATALWKELLRSLAYAMVQYLAVLSTQED